MRKKSRIYALFQFLTFIALLLIVASILIFSIKASTQKVAFNLSYWRNQFVSIASFSSAKYTSIVASLSFYIGILVFISSWVMGYFMFVIKERNFFDSMFLMFILVPVISNIFALIAQLSPENIKYTSSKIAKKEIKEEKTKIIELFNSRKSLKVKPNISKIQANNFKPKSNRNKWFAIWQKKIKAKFKIK